MVAQESFLNLRYLGRRFDDHALPLSYLGELGAFQKLLNELFQARYFKDHPDRKRSPNGFKSQLTLKVKAIGIGSVTATLEPETQNDRLEMGPSDGLSQALSDFLNLVDGKEWPSQREKTLAKHFRDFGANLADDEAIELSHGNRQVRYDQAARKRILQRLHSPYSRTSEQVFAVSEHDKHRKTFKLLAPEGYDITVPYDFYPELEAFGSELFQSFESIEKNAKVLVTGQFTFVGDRIKTVEPESMEPLGDRDLRWRIPFLKHKNLANSKIVAALSAFDTIWLSYLGKHVDEHPSLYVLDEEGTISAEWDVKDGETGSGEVSLVRNAAGGIHLLYLLDDGAESDEQTYSLPEIQDSTWSQVAAWIARYVNEKRKRD